MTEKAPTLADAEKYLAHHYVEGEFDCGSLTVLVQQELFGRKVDIPHAAERARGARHQAADLERYQSTFGEIVAQPATGDAVIMWSTEGTAPPPLNRRWHVGTAFVQNSEVWVLHLANEKRGAALQRLSQLEQQGVHVDAFYAWCEPKTTELALYSRPARGEVQLHYCLHGTTLAELLASKGVLPGNGWRVQVGGVFVPHTMWPLTKVRHGVKVEARARVKKQVLAIVAMLVLTYFTFGIGAYGGAILGGYGFVAAAAVFVAGSMLISKYLGPKPMSMGSMDNMQAPATYSLSDGRNQARPWRALSMILGKSKAIPDKGNNGYVWYDGEDQYYSAIFQAGINCAKVEDIRIGETPITSYEGVTIRRYGFPTGNDGDPPALGTSVDTIAGGSIENPATNPAGPGVWVTRTTSSGTVRFELDLEGTVQNMTDKGKWISHTVSLEIRYRPVGTGEGFWFTTAYQITNMGPKGVRRTVPFDVPEGQYEVQVRKIQKDSTGDGNDQRMQNTITWNALKSYQPDRADYGGQPRVEIRIKASGQLNGALNEVNWIATQNGIPLWNGTEWVQVTEEGAAGISNPGALILMLLRGLYRPTDNRRIAGAGFADNRIDIESLKGFMVRCIQKNFRFDFFMQEDMNMDQLLEAIAAAGMATLSRQNSGRIGVVWFAEDQPIEGIINMCNMRTDEDKGVKQQVISNFSVSYDLVRTADEFELEYFDRDRDWSWQPIRVAAPGIVQPNRTSSENVRGVTTEAQAARLARFIMAQNLYGRKTISFDMALDYMDMKRGAVFSLSHDLTQWGHGGRLAAFRTIPGGVVLTLDEPAREPLMAPSQRVVGVKLPGERQMRLLPVASVSADGLELTVNQAWPNGAPVPGTNFAVHDALYIYDFKATPGQRVRIVSIMPSSDSEYANITCTPEFPEFWQYVETGAYVPPPNNSNLETDLPVASNLKVTRGKIQQGGAWVHQLTASFDIRGNYDHGQLWAGAVGTPLELIDAQVFGQQVSWIVPADNTWNVEIRPFDSLGRPGTKAALIFADPPEAVDGVEALSVTATNVGIMVRWQAPQGLSAIGWATTQVKVGPAGSSWETATLVFDGKTDSCNIGWLAADDYLVFAAHFNSAGDRSAVLSVPFEVLPPGQPILVDDTYFEQVQIDWEDCTTTQPIRGYEIRIGPLYASAPVKTEITALGYVYTPPGAGQYRFWVVAIDVAGNRGPAGTVLVETVANIADGIEELQEGLDEAFQDIIDLGEALNAEALARGTAITETQQMIEDGDQALASMISTITARGNGGNLLQNSELVSYPFNDWITGHTLSNPVDFGRWPNADYTLGGGSGFMNEIGASDGSEERRSVFASVRLIPVVAGSRYQFSAYTGAHRAKVVVLITFLNSAGVEVNRSLEDANASNDFEKVGGPNIADWKRTYVFATAGVGAVSAQVIIKKYSTKAGYSNSYGFFSRPMFSVAGASQTVPDEYIPAGLTPGMTAGVQIVAEAKVGEVTSAMYTLALTAGGKIAGFKAGISGGVSSMVFLFDRVSFAISDADGAPRQLLTLGTVAGSPSIGINGNLYLDGFLIARHIQADQIDAIHMRANAITADKLAAGSVTAMKMAIGVSGNMLKNSRLMSLRGWTVSVKANCDPQLNHPNLGLAYRPGEENTFTIHEFVEAGVDPNNPSYIISEKAAVTPGKRYECSAYTGSHRCRIDIYLAWSDASGAWAGNTNPGEAQATNDEEAAGGGYLSNFKRIYSFGVAPNNASAVQVVIRKFGTKYAGNDSWLMMTMPYLGAAGNAQVTPADYSVAGTGTLIGPEGIQVNKLSAITAEIGLLRTAISGQRSEISDAGHSVYDFNNVRRVMVGIY